VWNKTLAVTGRLHTPHSSCPIAQQVPYFATLMTATAHITTKHGCSIVFAPYCPCVLRSKGHRDRKWLAMALGMMEVEFRKCFQDMPCKKFNEPLARHMMWCGDVFKIKWVQRHGCDNSWGKIWAHWHMQSENMGQEIREEKDRSLECSDRSYHKVSKPHTTILTRYSGISSK